MADISRGATASSTVYPILKLNEAKAVTPISKSAAFTLELTGGDYKTVILMANAGSASANVVFSVGNGIQGAGANLTVAVAASASFLWACKRNAQAVRVGRVHQLRYIRAKG